MFATVRFGANCQEMVNLLCCVQTLTGHLKWKCQCRPEDCIDLMDEKGTLMNLSKVEDPASEYASKYLQGRQRYILIRAVREENSEAICYESLLEDLGKHYPELPAGKQLWKGLVTPQIGCSSSQQRLRGQSRGRRAPCRELSLTPAPEPGTEPPYRARGAWNTRAPLNEEQTHHWSAQPPPGSYSRVPCTEPLSPQSFTHPTAAP